MSGRSLRHAEVGAGLRPSAHRGTSAVWALPVPHPPPPRRTSLEPPGDLAASPQVCPVSCPHVLTGPVCGTPWLCPRHPQSPSLSPSLGGLPSTLLPGLWFQEHRGR